MAASESAEAGRPAAPLALLARLLQVLAAPHPLVPALTGLGALLDAEDLQATFGAARLRPLQAGEGPTSTFAPKSGHESATRAYVVTVRHGRGCEGARSELHRATLADITDVGSEAPIADLVLVFDPDAAPVVEHLVPERLVPRCVFAGSMANERFGTDAGTLCDVEAVLAEGRLDVRLRPPPG